MRNSYALWILFSDLSNWDTQFGVACFQRTILFNYLLSSYIWTLISFPFFSNSNFAFDSITFHAEKFSTYQF